MTICANSFGSGNSATAVSLMKSVRPNHPGAAELLRRGGASLDHRNRAGESARDLAAAAGDDAPSSPASADTEEELTDKVAAHAAQDHGVPEVTPELAAKIKAAIRRQ